MRIGRSLRLASLALLGPLVALAAKPKTCVSTDQAQHILNKDICVSAHVYDVVALQDGTRFLDVCSPDTPDDQCRFTVVSLWEDHSEVGELNQYRNQDVQIRGLVQPLRGRAGMMLSHSRQFSGGPPKFRPNPLLARGFSAEQDRPPIGDPNLRSQGGHRSFMNTRDREPLPAR